MENREEKQGVKDSRWGAELKVHEGGQGWMPQNGNSRRLFNEICFFNSFDKHTKT